MNDPNTPADAAANEALESAGADQAALEARAELAEKQRDEYLALLKAKQAEFENYQKRNAREREQERKYVFAPLARDLLPALDNLERALDAAHQAGDEGPLVKGVELVQKQLLEVLRKHGVTPMATEPGTPFDPDRHDAVMQQPSAEHPAGSVVQVLQAGYLLHDRVLRPASVIVAAKQE
jgi:molecular chaperone GrpE